MKLKKNALPIVLFLFVLLSAGFFFFSSFDANNTNGHFPDASTAVIKTEETQFGLSLEQYDAAQYSIGRNEFLSNILQRHHIDLQVIASIAEKSKPVFDVRKISAGNTYSVFRDKRDSARLAYFVYQPNQVDYIVYDLRDSIRVYAGKKLVESRIETVAGVISSSLYETLQEKNASPELAVQLAEIYGWAVNFYRINAGDWFKIQYERQYVNNLPISPGKILAAVFSQNGKEYQAYQFQPDSSKAPEYYDENGKSLRRSFLKAPLKYSRISSRFTLSRFHPVQRRWKAHFGTDFAAPRGTPIIATGNGVIVESAFSQFNGNYVKIKHNNTYATQYLHMSRRAVKKGQHISQGQVIGYVGSTGLATGPHVCYRFWKNGKQVDALKQYFPPTEPIASEYLLAFTKTINKQQRILTRLNPADNPAGQVALAFYDGRNLQIKGLFPDYLFGSGSEEIYLVNHGALNSWF